MSGSIKRAGKGVGWGTVLVSLVTSLQTNYFAWQNDVSQQEAHLREMHVLERACRASFANHAPGFGEWVQGVWSRGVEETGDG